MRKERSPMIKLVERQLEPNIKPRTGLTLMIIFAAAFMVVNVALNAYDLLPGGWQLVITSTMLVGGMVWVVRRAARANRVSVGEYISQMFTQPSKRGW